MEYSFNLDNHEEVCDLFDVPITDWETVPLLYKWRTSRSTLCLPKDHEQMPSPFLLLLLNSRAAATLKSTNPQSAMILCWLFCHSANILISTYVFMKPWFVYWVLSYLLGQYLEAPPPAAPIPLEHVQNNPHASQCTFIIITCHCVVPPFVKVWNLKSSLYFLNGQFVFCQYSASADSHCSSSVLDTNFYTGYEV